MAASKATKATNELGAVMVHPGERAVLLSHHEYRLARQVGKGLEDYDILMRQPNEDDAPGQEVAEAERWQLVRADKYLKHRATGWREAESLEELPEQWRPSDQGSTLFPDTA